MIRDEEVRAEMKRACAVPLAAITLAGAGELDDRVRVAMRLTRGFAASDEDRFQAAVEAVYEVAHPFERIQIRAELVALITLGLGDPLNEGPNTPLLTAWREER